ncbi:hypothetical protein C8J57DRAFT_1242870 [Mycena rebaudengoi]|nr:hypothetical protein C8J57DRAFT_1242870 [Mycena rebaudengoi]
MSVFKVCRRSWDRNSAHAAFMNNAYLAATQFVLIPALKKRLRVFATPPRFLAKLDYPAHFAAPCPETAGGPLAARTTAYGISRRVRLPGIGVSSLLWCSLGARRANRDAMPRDPPPGCKI